MSHPLLSKFHLWTHPLTDISLDIIVAGLYQMNAELESIDKKINQSIDLSSVSQLIQEAKVSGELNECVVLSLPQLKDQYLFLGLGKKSLISEHDTWKTLVSQLEDKLATLQYQRIGILIDSFIHPTDVLDKKDVTESMFISLLRGLQRVISKQVNTVEFFLIIPASRYDDYLDKIIKQMRVINETTSLAKLYLHH